MSGITRSGGVHPINASEIAQALGGQRSGSGWSAHCPAHEDRSASLSVSEEGGRVLVHCHAGCTQEAVIDALRVRGLWTGRGAKVARTSSSGRTGNAKPQALVPIPMEKAKDSFKAAIDSDYTRKHYGTLGKTYCYRLPDGGRAFIVCRYQKNGTKDIRPWYFGEDERWHVGQALEDGRPLYHLPELLADPAAPVLVVEGEKCAEVHVPAYVVTTWAGGAKAVRHTDWSPLKDRNVVVWPDHDGPGIAAAREILELIPQAKVLDIKDQPNGWDIADAQEEGIDLPTFISETPDAELQAWKTRHRAEAAGASDGRRVGKQPALITCTFDQIEPEPLRWLWPEVIPLGKLSLLVGDPGVGKSLVSLDLAARVTRGATWPDGSFCSMGRVLLLSAEDDPGDTIRPRLDAAGAMVSAVELIEGIRRKSGRPGSFNLGEDVAALDELLAGNGSSVVPVRLVIIDPISAYLGTTDSHVNASVREVLAPLAALAAKHKVAVVAVSHLNKTGGPAMYRTTGSLAFTAAARAVWAVGRDKEEQARILMLPVKQNLAADRGGFAYRICVSAEGVPIVQWEGERVQGQADSILSHDEPGDRAAWSEAADWLRDRLADGPVPAKDLQREAEAAGITQKALRVARGRLGVTTHKADFAGGWCWELPARKVPKMPEDAQDAHPPELGIFGEEGHLREPVTPREVPL